MRHLLLEQWSRRASPIHSLSARTKFAALLIFLIAVSLSPQRAIPVLGSIVFGTILASRLPLFTTLQRAAIVLPFSGLFALLAWLAGDASRALVLLAKSYTSALAAILFIATTPIPAWTAALRSWHVPATLVSIIEFVYRYLFLVVEEAQVMATAARARGGLRFEASVGILTGLFSRSWRRAESVHHAMLARGYRT